MPRAIAPLLLLLATALPAQIIEGSFEGGTPGAGPPAPWSANQSNSIVQPSGACFGEPLIGLPSDGTKWFMVHAGSSTSTPSDYRSTASDLQQTFSWNSGSPVLNMDVAFITYESVGSTTYNDFTAVEVESGATWVTLLFIDTATGSFPNTSVCGSRPMTDLIHISADLSSLFPGSSGSTVFTLHVFAANQVDSVNDPRVYVDHVFAGAPPAAPLDVSIAPVGAGLWLYTVSGAAYPFAEIYNFFSFTPAIPTGSGPFLGLNLDPTIFQAIGSTLGTHPFHVLLDASGQYVLGPFGWSLPGLTVDYMSVALAGGTILDISPAHSVTF